MTTNVPFQRPAADPAFEAHLLATLDAESGNLAAAVARLYANFNSPLPDKRAFELYDTWRRHPITHELLYPWHLEERANLTAYIENLDNRRKGPSPAERIAEKLRLEEGILANARWHRDARVPASK